MTGPGGNYGWNVKEGSFCFDDSGFAFDPEGGLCPGDDGSRIDPIAEYDTHLDGHSVMGGFVYRGAAIPDLVGHYVFGDFSKVFVFTFNDGVIKVSASPGRLFYLDDSNDIVEFKGDSPTGVVLGFGQDQDGELYVLGNDSGLPTGDSGTISKLIASKKGGGRP